MRKLLFVAALTAILFSCEDNTEQEALPDNHEVSAAVETLVLKDAEIEEAVEVSDSEIDQYSSTCSQGYVSRFGRLWQNQLLLNQVFGSRYSRGKCPGFYTDSEAETYPKTITIDYGDGLEFCRNEEVCRTISGKIIITLSAPPFENGSKREITYENFTIDSLSMTGTKTMTYEGTDTTRVISISSEMTYTFADETTITRKANRIKTWTAGLDTPFNPFDDEIEITGSVEVNDREGNVILKKITTPLVKTGACLFTTKGVITIYKNGIEVGNLNYGDGTCDFKAELTLNGETEEIFVGLQCGKYRV